MAEKTKTKSETQATREEIDHAFAYQEGPWKTTSDRLLRAFKGQYYGSSSGLDRYVINTIFAMVNLILPNLIFSKPYIKCKAATPFFYRKRFDGSHEKMDNIAAAETMEAAINHVMTDIDAWENMQAAIQDALIYSKGFCKTGYSVETESEDDFDFIKDENPFVARVCPKDIGFHPLATKTDNAAIMVHHMIRHRDDLEANKNYKGIETLKASLPDYLKEKLDKFQKGDAAADYIRIWEVHDQKKGIVRTYGGEQKKMIWKRDRSYQFKGSDFTEIWFAGDNDEFLKIPLLGMIEDQALALNQLLTMMMRHIKMFPGVVDTQEGELDENDLKRMKNQEQGSVHSWSNLNAIKRTPPMQMGSEYFSMVNLLFNIIDRILGVPDFQRLGGGSDRKTATEATYQESNSTIRREFYVNTVKKFILANVRRVAAIILKEFSEERLIRITGSMESKFVKFSKDDFSDKIEDYLFDFDIDSMRFINEGQVQALINSLKALAENPFLQPIIGTLDPEMAAKEIFKRMNLNIESLRPRDHSTKLYFSIEKENELVKSGSHIPDPKFDEDHKAHIEGHQEISNIMEGARHIKFHQAMLAQKQPQVQVGAPPAQQGQSGQGPQPNPPPTTNPAGIVNATTGAQA